LAKLVPKSVPEDGWVAMIPDRDYAVRLGKNDNTFLRFGPGQGIYLSIEPGPSGRFIYSLDYETGEPTLLARMPENQTVAIGRTSECLVKIMHAIVSRRHLEMRLDGDIVILRDLGSTNGSFLLADMPYFDIAGYIEANPLDKVEERTLDGIHEQFGPTLDDFLRRYSAEKKGQ
jgi:hypothetical protein